VDEGAVFIMMLVLEMEGVPVGDAHVDSEFSVASWAGVLHHSLVTSAASLIGVLSLSDVGARAVVDDVISDMGVEVKPVLASLLDDIIDDIGIGNVATTFVVTIGVDWVNWVDGSGLGSWGRLGCGLGSGSGSGSWLGSWLGSGLGSRLGSGSGVNGSITLRFDTVVTGFASPSHHWLVIIRQTKFLPVVEFTDVENAGSVARIVIFARNVLGVSDSIGAFLLVEELDRIPISLAHLDSEFSVAWASVLHHSLVTTRSSHIGVPLLSQASATLRCVGFDPFNEVVSIFGRLGSGLGVNRSRLWSRGGSGGRCGSRCGSRCRGGSWGWSVT